TPNSVTATLNAAKTGVTLNWSNPANVAGITSVRIIRNAYSSSTIPDFISTGATTSEAASAIASSTTEATAATADVPSARLTPNNYYDFKVNPIYTGSVFGTVSAATARVYIPPAATAFRSLRASLDTAKTGLALSWINPLNAAGITSIRITRQAYLTATGVADGTPVTTTTTAASAIASTDFGETEATFALTGLPTNRYYTYTVTPTYAGNFEGPETAPSPIRYYIPPAIVGGVNANLNADKTSVALSWNNPANAAGLFAVRITRQAYLTQTGAADGEPVIVPTSNLVGPRTTSSMTQPTSIDVTTTGLATDRYYTFTVTPIFADLSRAEGLTTAATPRLYVPPATSALTATLTSDSSGVVLGWTNPTNAPGIVAIRITRQAYTAVTGGNTDGAATSMLYTDISDLMPGAASRLFRIGDEDIVPGKHYEFTITPIYEGGAVADIEGLTSTTPSRVIFTGLPSVRDLSAAANTTIIRLTWTNLADVLGISITQTSGGSTTTIVDNANTENLIRQGSKAFYDVQGLSASTSYTFSVTPIYAGDVDGVPATVTTSLRAAGSGHSDFDNVPDAEDVDNDGDGLIEIYNVNDLNMMRDDLSGASLAGNSSGCGGDLDDQGLVIENCNGYELMAHMDLNDLEPDLSISNWEPVGFCSGAETPGCSANAFSGDFDGNNYNISNMRIIPIGNRFGLGFFGSVLSGELRNLVIRNASIDLNSGLGSSFIGGLAGYGENTNIIHSAVELNEVVGAAPGNGGAYVGGLAGRCEDCNIISSAVIANSILGRLYAAGLIGASATSDNNIISSMVIVRNIEDNSIGASGLAGIFNGNVKFSAAVTNIISSRFFRVAALIGDIGNSGTSINSTYAISSSVSADSGQVGGIIGTGLQPSLSVLSIESSYYNVTSFSHTPNTVDTALPAVGDQPSLQPSS
ncbi:MAG: hypothetical protein K0U41_04485, partial [Gammaproteobacteria bacterium]|nr:hypothetical protein [Gammaproteobacteria bacterium]